MISSRSAADWRGSRLPTTATVTLPWWPAAIVHARRLAGVVGPRAEDPALLGRRRDRGVHAGVVGRGHDVPRAVEVGAPRSRRSCQVSSAAIPSIAGVTAGETRTTSRAGREQRGHPPLRDVPAADHHDPAPPEPEPHGIGPVARPVGSSGHSPRRAPRPSLGSGA